MLLFYFRCFMDESSFNPLNRGGDIHTYTTTRELCLSKGNVSILLIEAGIFIPLSHIPRMVSSVTVSILLIEAGIFIHFVKWSILLGWMFQSS